MYARPRPDGKPTTRNDQHDANVQSAPEPAPSLAEQRARRRHRRGIGGDIRKGVA